MAFPNASEIATDGWTVGELQKTQRGLSCCPISCDSKPAVYQLTSLSEPLLTPWGASAFKDPEATRLNVDANLDEHPKLVETLARIDEWAKDTLKKAGMEGAYKPLVVENAKYPPRLRMKMATAGQHATRLWSPDKLAIPDADLRGARITPIVQFSKLWQASGMTGLTCELKHAIVQTSAEAECPNMF